MENRLEGTAIHEFHHALDHRHKLQNTWQSNIYKQYEKDPEFIQYGLKHNDMFKVSEYATTNYRELFAEVGTAVMNDIKIPAKLKKAYEATMATVRSNP
jgi:hypothetical protein